MGQIGRLAGQFRRRNGAAGFTARAAPTREVAARRHRSRTIAMQDSPIGRRAGVLRRRLGAVPTRARAALQQLEGALESKLDVSLDDDAGPGSSGVIDRWALEILLPRFARTSTPALAPSSGVDSSVHVGGMEKCLANACNDNAIPIRSIL